MFDGIGGFPLAASRYEIKTLWASEIEPFPIKVTKIRFPNMKHLGDITKIDCNNLEPVDIVTGGSPCQDLSVAGKRAGLAGARSGLFMEQIRIVRELREIDKRNGRTGEFIRPRFMVWENVPGAFSSNKGEDFRAVLEETARIADETVIIPGPPKGKWNTVGAIMGNGWSIAWRVLDAQYWGVPQRRRRIFLVADFGGQSAPEILFKRQGLSRYSQESGEEGERIAADAERGVGTAVCYPINTQIITRHNKLGRNTGFGLGKEGDPAYTLQAGHEHGVVAPIAIDSDCLTPWDVQSRRIHKASGKWPALYGGEGGGHGYVAIPVRPVAIENHPADSRVKLDESGTVQTLTTRMGTGGGNVPMLAVPDKAYSIQGSMIGRADKNGPQGNGINEDVSFTLNTTDRHAVATKVYGIGAYNSEGMKSSNPHSGIYEAETSRTLDLNGGSPACNQGGMAIVQGYDAYQHHNWREADKLGPMTTGVGRVRGDTPLISTYSFQRSDEFKETNKASTQPRRQYKDATDLVCSVDCRNFNETDKHGTLQAKGNGGQSLNYMGAVREGYSVRRLTPLECERLQGFPDGWTYIPGQTEATQEELEFWREVWLTWDKLQAEEPEEVKPRNDKRLLKWLKNPVSDSAQYKALGNSVAIPCVEYVLEGIKEVLEGMSC